MPSGLRGRVGEESFLVTGALGCIGAWTVKNLLREGVPTVAFDLGTRLSRLQLLLDSDELGRVRLVSGDICDRADLQGVMESFGVTNVIHLAALQLPFCRGDPAKGALVNVVGTVNVFEAARHLRLRRIVFASSTAVYGPSEDYPEGALPHNAPLLPRSHYGVYKQANEGSARVYWLEEGIASIGLRPHVVYGAGRDQGMTSGPSRAMLAASLGRPFRNAFGGRYCFQYADDVARTFIMASRAPFEGAEVFNIGGPSASTAEIMACIEQEVPSLKGRISFADEPLPFPEEVDNSALVEVLGCVPSTPLQEGVAETIRLFRSAYEAGTIPRSELEAILESPGA